MNIKAPPECVAKNANAQQATPGRELKVDLHPNALSKNIKKTCEDSLFLDVTFSN